jgi:hypothetical protein
METATGALRDAETIRIAELAPGSVRKPWYLVDLDEAAEVGREIKDHLETSRLGAVLSIDLEGVVTRASCAALMFGPALRRPRASATNPEHSGGYLVLLGPLGSNERDVRLGLEDEGLIAVVREAGGSRLTGKTDRVLDETYRFFSSRREVTSAMLTEPPFGLKLTAANARVAKMHRLGLLHFLRVEVMEAGGRRYVYEVVR